MLFRHSVRKFFKMPNCLLRHKYPISLQGSLEGAKILLPIEIKSLEDAAKACLKNTEATQKVFEQVWNNRTL